MMSLLITHPNFHPIKSSFVALIVYLLASVSAPTWGAPSNATPPKPSSASQQKSPDSATSPSATVEVKINFNLSSVCEKGKCEPMLLLDAPINKSLVDQFEKNISSLPDKTTVLLNSSTGDLNSGIKLGELFRQKNFNTRVGRATGSGQTLNRIDGQCYSACVLAFAGGMVRHIDLGDQIGIYALRANSKNISNAEFKSAVNRLGAYLEKMGVDRRLIEGMLKTKGTAVSIISLNSAKLLNLDNSSQSHVASWGTQALQDGTLIGLISEKQTNGQYVISLGLTKQKEGFRLSIFIKPLSDTKSIAPLNDFLSRNAKVQIKVRSLSFGPQMLKPWETTASGIQTAVLLTDKELNQISSALAFELNLDAINGNTFGLDSSTIFGTSGLKGVLSSLKP